MKVQELVGKINNEGFNLEQELQIKKYLPIEVKKTIAQAIIYECTDYADGIATMDSVQKHLSYVKYMITTHTNLEYTDNDYDVLGAEEYNGVRLLDRIMKCFEDDAKECKKILNFMVEDAKREMSLELSIAKFLNGLNSTVDKLAENLASVDLQSMIPNDLDMGKLSNFLQNYIK